MSSNGTNTTNSTADDDSGIGGWAIWLIIFLITCAFFYSIVMMVCYHEYKKYRFRKPKIFNPNGNYPKQVLSVPPPRTDQPTTGNYPKQQYVSLDSSDANFQQQSYKLNSEAIGNTNQIVSDIEGNKSKSEDQSKTCNVSTNDVPHVHSEDRIIIDADNVNTKSDSEQMSISLPSPTRKKTELPPLQDATPQRLPGDESQRVVSVGFVEKPLPSIQDGDKDPMTPVVSINL